MRHRNLCCPHPQPEYYAQVKFARLLRLTVLEAVGFVNSDDPELEIPDRELSDGSSLREKQLKVVLADLHEQHPDRVECEAKEIGLLAESTVELVGVYEKLSRSAQLPDASDVAKADQFRVVDAQKAALLAARMALKDRCSVIIRHGSPFCPRMQQQNQRPRFRSRGTERERTIPEQACVFWPKYLCASGSNA